MIAGNRVVRRLPQSPNHLDPGAAIGLEHRLELRVVRKRCGLPTFLSLT